LLFNYRGGNDEDYRLFEMWNNGGILLVNEYFVNSYGITSKEDIFSC
jgi:hypothetical protein